jgi:hypothetical protein
MNNHIFGQRRVCDFLVASFFLFPALLAGFLLAKPVSAASWATSSAVMNVPRGSFASAVVDGRIYAVGGDVWGNVPTNSIESLDPSSGPWRPEVSTIEARWGLVAASIDGQLITVAAGSPTPNGSMSTEIYNPDSGFTLQGEDMPNPGWGAATAVVGRKMYVLGGYNWTDWGQKYNREYDSVTGHWESRRLMPTRRSWLSAEAINGKIYALGGWDWNDSQDLPTLEIYDPSTDEWRPGPSLPIGLKGIATAVLDGKLYAIGGNGQNGVSDKVYLLDSLDELAGWRELPERLPLPLTGAQAELINGTIYLLGGFLSDGSVNGRTYYLGDGPAPAKRNPVIIVPGIIGSNLYTDTPDIIWIDPIDYIGDPFDLKLDYLKMNDQGGSKINLIAKDIVRDVYGADFYGQLVDRLLDDGYVENVNLFVFPYDWRLDLDAVSGNDYPCEASTTIKCLIEEVKRENEVDKIDVIAHSMGGLVVKDYVAKFGQDSIDKFIDIATPHLGAPKAAKILNYGDNMDIVFLSQGKIKEISQNMPAIYQLLPSESYFDQYDYYILNSSATKLNLPVGELDYSHSMEFLSKTGDDGRYFFINKNSLLHSRIDNVKIDNSYNISGCGMATIGKIKAAGKKAFVWSKYDIEYVDGDGTVPLRSADYYGDTDRKYYLKGGNHSKVPGAGAVKNFVSLVLAGKENEFDFSSHDDFSNTDDICGISGYDVSFHCPADLHVYDENGSHTGPLANGDIENNIPGAQYDIIEGNKFIFLPKDGDYRIVGEATGTGTLEIAVKSIEEGEYVMTEYFNSVPLASTLTRAEFDLNQGQGGVLVKVDGNGDGVFEQEMTPDSVLTGEEVSDMVKPETSIAASGNLGDNGYYVSGVRVNLNSNDDNSGVLKTEYSLDSGANWTKYENGFVIDRNGPTVILYSSTDRAGNREEDKEITINIDKEVPEIIMLVPQQGQEFMRGQKVEIEYLLEDGVSGVMADSDKVYFDGRVIDGVEIDLFNYALGQHSIRVVANDLAGNLAEKEVDFYVAADIDSAISDIERLYVEKEIVKKKAKEDLVSDLEWIKKYLDKNAKKDIKKGEVEKRIMDKCIDVKGTQWCSQKLGKVLERIDYKMDKIGQRLIKLKYELILNKVSLYRKLNWLTPKAEDMIKEDVNYLISRT